VPELGPLGSVRGALRVFLRSLLRSWPAPDERGAGRDDDEGFGDAGELLVVASEAAVLHDPGEGSLHHPTAWQHLKTLGRRVAPDDLQDDVGLVLRPRDEAARIAAISIGPLHKGVSRSRALQHALAAVAILDIRAMDMNGEQPAVGVGQDVALASGDLLSSVVALRAPL